MLFLNLAFIPINSVFAAYFLWKAFAKVNRPITWNSFYVNLGVAGINFLAVVINIISAFHHI